MIRLLSFCMLLGLVAWRPAGSQIPRVISYQGVLKTVNDVIVPDGNYELTFRIYDEVTGDTLWTEKQSVQTTRGIFNANLGSVTTLDLPFDKGYVLGLAIGANPELTPRIKLTAAPYSFHAQTADTAFVALNTTGEVWQTDGTNVWRIVGNVGIGLTSPQKKLHVGEGILVSDNTASQGPHLRFDADAQDWQIGGGGSQLSDGRANKFEIRDISRTATRVAIDVDGNVGIGTTSPSEKLDVAGTAQVTGLKMATGAAGGHVLKSDAAGLGTWQPDGLTLPYSGSANTPGTCVDLTQTGSGTAATISSDNATNSNPAMSVTHLGLGNAAVLAATSSAAATRIINSGTGACLEARAQSSGWSGYFWGGPGNTSHKGVYISSGTNQGLVVASGNVGIGVIDPTNILTIAPNSPSDPIADAWLVYSGIDYKQSVRELSEDDYTEALRKVMATPVIKFRYKGQTAADKEKIGILIEQAPPEIVAEGNRNAASLGEYISLLHAAIKAQHAEITALKKTVAELERRR